MDDTQKLLAYFAKRHKKASVTALMKLCYLTDLVAVKRLGKKISNYKYYRYTFGPFDAQIYKDLESMVEQGILKTDIYYTDYGDDNEVLSYKFARDNLDDINLSDEQLSAAEEVLRALGGYGPKALTEVAYKTKPMIRLGATLGGIENIGARLNLNAS